MYTYTPRATDTLLLEVCGPTTLHVGVQGNFRPDTTTGLQLHLRYEVRSSVGRPCRPCVGDLAGDKTDGPMSVEFDVGGEIQLNYPGTVYLTGGDPQWSYDIFSYQWESDFRKTWHPLTALVAGSAYVLPVHHSQMRATETLTYLCNGCIGELSHLPVPCIGGTLILQETGKTIITEWWG